MKALVQPLSASLLVPLAQGALPHGLETRGAGAGHETGPALPGRETLGDRVTDELSALLIAGRVAPGEKLSLRKVAEAVGVSMMPVREAMSRLAADGALDILPGKAVRVPVLTLSQFRELTQIRLVVEGFAAEEATRKASADEIDCIAAHEEAFRLAASSEPAETAKAVAFNRDLHFALYESARMPTLVDMIKRLWLKAGPILNLHMRSQPGRIKGGSAVRAHADLVAAMRNRDAPAARQALEADIRAAAQQVEMTGQLLPD